MEKYHVQRENPENRDGAYAVENGLVKTWPPGQLLPVASKVKNAKWLFVGGGLWRTGYAAPFELISES